MVARSSLLHSSNLSHSITRIIITLSFLTTAKCEINPRNGESPSSLVIQVLRNYENTWKIAGDTSKSSSVTAQCQGDVETVLRGYAEKDFWAMKIADASGRIASSFVWGSNFYLGSKVACDSLNNAKETLGLSPEVKSVYEILDQTSSVAVSYQVFVSNFTSPHQIDVQFNVRPLIHLGLCLPKSCDPRGFYRSIKESLESSELYTIENVTVQYHKEGLDSKAVLFEIPEFYVFLIICGLSMGSSVIYSFICTEKKDEHVNVKPPYQEGSKKPSMTTSKLMQILSCFSLQQNLQKLFSTTSLPREIRPINGLKTIACLWIIVLHTNVLSLFAQDNLPELQLMQAQPNLLVRILFYGFAMVDYFFLISGFLLVFNFRNNAKLQKEIRETPWSANVKKYLRLIFNRYLRLTPSVIFLMIVMRLTRKYLHRSSVFDIQTNGVDMDCSSSSILRNLVYSQNLGDNFVCGSYLWYLANDMQYYVTFLALLFVHTKFPVIAKTVFGVITVGALSGSFVISLLNGLTFQSDVMYQLFRTIYTAPHIRVVPYLAGMLIGYLGNWMEINLLEINRTWVRVGWNVFSGFLLLPILIAHDPSTLSTFTCALTYSFLKFISSLCVGGLIILCAFSPEGRVQRFLSHGCFVHLNKMSYGMYVIHPIVILLVFGLQSHPVLLDDISWVVYSVPVVVITYVFALCQITLIEMPFVKLSKLNDRNTTNPRIKS